ncbi:site-2 protease family protein [archaeon]|nr:site-2 protease family protein [archaeon]
MSFTLFFVVVSLGWLIILGLEKVGKLPAERHAIILLFKTERFKGFIDRVARFKRFWKVFGSAGIVFGILGMVLVVITMLLAAYSTYIGRKPVEGAMFVIPGVTIPFWYGIIALITVLVVHEFAHGILARREGISIKSMGAILVTIIPIGAFVEPDEEELEAAARGPRMRVYSAGPFANMVVAIFSLVLIIAFSGFLFNAQVVEIDGVVEGSPAFGVLEEGMVLEEINGLAIQSPKDFVKATVELEPDKDVTIKTDRGTFTITSTTRVNYPDRGYIGIFVTSPFNGVVQEYIYGILYWIFLLNQGIGLINMAPLHLGIAATDGHHILRDVLSKIGIKGAEKATMAVSKTVTFVLLLVLVGPLFSSYFGV